MKEKKFRMSTRVRGMVTGTSVLLLLCVAAAGALAGTIHAHAKEDSSGVAAVNAASKADLSCTYYDQKTRPHPGTCVMLPGDSFDYFCAENGTKKFELQTVCKGKVERARGAETAERAAKKEQGAKEQGAKEQGAKEQGAKEQAAKEQAAGSDGNAGKVYTIGNGVTPPVTIYAPPVKFTKEARKAKYQGVVDLQIIVTKQGRPADIKVVRHLGMGLDEQAVKAVKQYRFEPARYNGLPVAVRMIVEVRFQLR